MSGFSKQFRSELEQLPTLLAKLIGGVVAAVAIGRFAYGATHSSVNVPDLLLCGLGIGIFIVASRLGERRARENPVSVPEVEGQLPTSGPAWILFLFLAAILAATSALMAR